MQSGIDVLDRTVQQTNQWLDDVAALLDAPGRGEAYLALRAVLHALRDRVGADAAAHLAAQLPLLIRGLFYDGYRLDQPRERTCEAFLAHIDGAGLRPLGVAPQQALRAVLKVMAEHLEVAELEKLARLFPVELRELWPDLPNLPAPPPSRWQAEAPPRRASRGPRHGGRKTEKGHAHRR